MCNLEIPLLYMSRVYHGRTKDEGCDQPRKIDLIPTPPLQHTHTQSNTFTYRSKAVLLLWFTMYVIVCLCMYVLVKIFILDRRLASYFGEKGVLLHFCL